MVWLILLIINNVSGVLGIIFLLVTEVYVILLSLKKKDRLQNLAFLLFHFLM